jgi:hypothetical protein
MLAIALISEQSLGQEGDNMTIQRGHLKLIEGGGQEAAEFRGFTKKEKRGLWIGGLATFGAGILATLTIGNPPSPSTHPDKAPYTLSQLEAMPQKPVVAQTGEGPQAIALSVDQKQMMSDQAVMTEMTDYVAAQAPGGGEIQDGQTVKVPVLPAEASQKSQNK